MTPKQSMKIAKISSPGKNAHNEDLIAAYQTEGAMDIVIMDGGTSVADRIYTDSAIGDVVWFVRNFALSLEN
jgi:molybdopterin biosynthesis enzyme